MNRELKRFNNRGISILEALIAVFITAVLTTSILHLYVTQHKNYMIQDDVTDIQQSVRASIDELSRQLRMAGADLPLGLDAIEAYDTNPDTVVLVYQGDDCNTFLSSAMPQPSAELKCGNDISCFFQGQWIYIYEADSAIGEWFEITEVQEASMHLQHRDNTFSRSYGANALVLGLTRVKFYIDNVMDPDHPKLMVQFMGQPPQVYAENIIDLQFNYVMKNGNVESVPSIAENIREIQINVTGQSENPERDNEGNETYRNRTFSTSVYLRNVGI